MNKFIIVRNHAVQVSINYEDAIEQIINAFILNNLGTKNIKSILNLVNSTLEQIGRYPKDFNILFSQALDLGLELIGNLQAMHINKAANQFSLTETKLQILYDLLFESDYFVRVGPDFDLYYTDRFYNWFDQEIMSIVIGGKNSDDEILMSMARSFRHNNQKHISEAYASIINECMNRNFDENNQTVIFH